ncbi:hypothetical protein [Micromonospora sp. NPDC049102]|uniref:hypothetical protein n=1 Tax=Micromonospora sp. NPDC049102 TaxID=3364265 RepID=UPI0037101D73
MLGVVGLECVEFLFTWVRSGVSVSLQRGAVSPQVSGVEPVPGLHLVHSASDVVGSAVLTAAVLAQPLGVLARMVDAPVPSGAALLDLDAAIDRAAVSRLPVYVPGRALAGVGSEFVLPLRTNGQPADADTADYVLVLPASHLVAEHVTAGLDVDGASVQSRSMPDLLRWAGERAEVGLPLPIVRARYRDSVWEMVPAGRARRVDGGIKGLWRALADLTLGQAARIDATTAEATESTMVLRDPDGLVLLRRTSTGVDAADLPRHPSALHLTPVTVSISAAGPPLAGVGVPALPGVHEDPGSVAVRLPAGGLMLLDADMKELIAAAESFRAAADEYAVFVHGSPFGAMVGGRRVTQEQLGALIAADPRSVGKSVILVQCDGGATVDVVDDYAAKLFAVLPVTTPRVLAMGGQAWVEPLPGDADADALSEVLVTRTELHVDGRIRLSRGGVSSAGGVLSASGVVFFDGVREYLPAPGAVQSNGKRMSQVLQYGPALSRARRGRGVALTNDAGVVLTGAQAPAPAALRALGLATHDDVSAYSPSIRAVSFPYPDTYIQSQEGQRIPFNQAYHDVMNARTAVDNAVASLRQLATEHSYTRLLQAIALFQETRHFHSADFYTMSQADYDRHIWLQSRAENTRHDVVGLAQAASVDLRSKADAASRKLHEKRNSTWRNGGLSRHLIGLAQSFGGSSGRLEAAATAMQDLAAQVADGKRFEDTWRRVSRDLARKIITEVRRRIPTGPANNYRVGDMYEDQAWYRLEQYVRNPKYQRDPDSFDVLPWVARTAYLADYFGVGACREFGTLAASLLWNHPELSGVPITLATHRRQLDHVFVVVGPVGHPNTLVVDAWTWSPSSTTIGHYFLPLRGLEIETILPDAAIPDLLAFGREQVQNLPPRPPALREVPPAQRTRSFRRAPGFWDTRYSYREDVGTANSDSEGESVGRRPVHFDVDSSVVPGVHEDPGSVAVRLPAGGLMLLDADMKENIAAAVSFRAAVDEYPVFVHGSVLGAVVGGFRVSEEQLGALIEADPLSVGKTVVLVQCGSGATLEVVNDYAARLFAVLTATPRVFGMGGQAWVQPLAPDAGAGELTEVRVTRTVVHADGRVRLLSSGGLREYVPAPAASQVAGSRVAKVVQHGPTLVQARHGVGVALTDGAGNVLTGDRAPTPAQLTALGLPDPARVRHEYDTAVGQEPSSLAQESVAAVGALGAGVAAASRPLRLIDGVRSHPNAYVVAIDEVSEPRREVAAIVEAAAGATHPVIVMDAALRGRVESMTSIGVVNYLLEQFAQRGESPVVVTLGAAGRELRQVAERYGTVVLHPTLQRTGPAGHARQPDSGLAALQTGHQWRAHTSDEDIWAALTTATLNDAARRAQPAAAVAPVDTMLGDLIWAPDTDTARTALAALRSTWSPEQLRQGLEQVIQINERVPDQPHLNMYAPVLQFAAAGHDNIVFDYVTNEQTRPKILLDFVGHLTKAQQLDAPTGDGLTTADLTSMLTATGTTDISSSILTVLADINAGRFTDATQFIENNRNTLTLDQRQQWVEAITDLQHHTPNNGQQLEKLAAAVYECGPAAKPAADAGLTR